MTIELYAEIDRLRKENDALKKDIHALVQWIKTHNAHPNKLIFLPVGVSNFTRREMIDDEEGFCLESQLAEAEQALRMCLCHWIKGDDPAKLQNNIERFKTLGKWEEAIAKEKA